MSDKLAIIVYGKRHVGKTPAIKTMAACLATHGINASREEMRRVVVTEGDPCDVTMILYGHPRAGGGTFSIGIESAGDIPCAAKKNHNRFIDDQCDVVVCATHGAHGDSNTNYQKKTINLFQSHGYTIERVSCKEGDSHMKTAAKIFRLVQEFVKPTGA